MNSTETLPNDRQPHASSDRGSRMLKARKIAAIIGRDRFAKARRVLEVGCGSGIISRALFELGGSQQAIDAVDVVDGRTEFEGFRFTLVNGTRLPFDSGAFDVAITNHVIEHVGDESAQIDHLREIRRVLAPNGLVYFAAPNKWRLIEPHFGMPLLSWLPQRLSDGYVRLAKRGTHYDCFPRSQRNLQRLFRSAGFAFQNRATQAVRETIAIEHGARALINAVARVVPNLLLATAMPLMPTYVFCLTPAHTS